MIDSLPQGWVASRRVERPGATIMGATLLSYHGERFGVGQVVYARLVVRGFSEDFDGRKCAVLEAVDKSGKPDPDCEPRLYYVPESHLIEGKIVVDELK